MRTLTALNPQKCGAAQKKPGLVLKNEIAADTLEPAASFPPILAARLARWDDCLTGHFFQIPIWINSVVAVTQIPTEGVS